MLLHCNCSIFSIKKKQGTTPSDRSEISSLIRCSFFRVMMPVLSFSFVFSYKFDFL